ncbi:hypothetical protein INR49_018163 [Caranx melampygus]|nr:hypothetical protein INR49_018163 [Caranx melampygus]
MDEFVHRKLTEWGLSDLIETFKDQGIDEESLYCLNDQDIDNLITQVGPRSKFRKRLKVLKAEQQATHQETAVSSPPHRRVEAADSAQVLPSTSGTSNRDETGKRPLDLQGESSSCLSPASKRRCDKRLGSYAEQVILSDMKNIIKYVNMRLQKEENTKLNDFLKSKICDLETDKRELVGVFGKTGAGKSSLINAVIGVKNLLPSGSVSACTSVMIKVEANKVSTKYEAEIEFITKEEWEDELWPLEHILRDDADQEKIDDDDDDFCAKLTALYGEEWRNMSTKTFMEERHFREIPEFLQCRKKILTSESAKELSAKLVKYTRSNLEEGEGSGIKRWYWPLVKCVTVRVPGNDYLQHVTLVDLPGNGDRNKSRDNMWKEIVGSCSTVWIVTEINRAASEREAWEILEDACSLMGNGGECQCIYFICTKSDHIEDSDDCQVTAVRDFVLKRNEKAKKTVMSEFRKDKKIKKHFSEECFKVFTVSSKEFLKRKYLQRDDTEKGPRNERKCGAFNGAIAAFTLDTKRLIQKYSEVELQLTFLQTEEEKIKRILDRMIQKQKKKLYRSLTEKIEEHMQGCYKRAATFSGPGVLKNMRDTIEWHIYDSKNIMFEQAKDVFLLHLNSLKVYVSAELDLVKKHYDEVNGSSDGETSLIGRDPNAPAAALGP